MDKLIARCQRLLNITKTDYVRDLMSEINWDLRLLSIRGARGVGKTTLMLQYLKMHGCDCKSSLYVSLDSAYFANHTLLDFAEKFYMQGGRHLFVDEVHKYPGWSSEVKEIYDSIPELKMVISGSSLLNILNADADLSRRCVPYQMQGLSYREFLGVVKGMHFPSLTLDDLLHHPNDLCNEVNSHLRPLAHFKEYLEQGYYPFILEGTAEYHTRLENVLNLIMEVEMPQMCGVDMSNIRKLKSLMTILAANVPMRIDTTKVSAASGIARTTLLAYLKFMQDARLLNLLYTGDDSVKKMQKPDKVYVENPNILVTLNGTDYNIGTMRETFVVNQLHHQHQLEYTRTGDVLIDRKYTIEIGGKSKDGRQIANTPEAYIAADDIEYPTGNKIPLWAFGFLY